MPVKRFATDLIDDNPYNPRKHYAQAKVKEMAQSLREVGLLQAPKGRQADGRVQLAYGHMRLRGFLQNQKKEIPPANEQWKMMPVDVMEISDQDMFHYAMEENLRRTDITPIEVARCIEALSGMFPDVTEKELGEKHGMSEANVSNMKRVLRLPEKILEKIDVGRITFTQGRELIILEKLENSEELMLSAVRGIRTEGRPYGHANTVEGMQVCVHDVISNHCRPLDKQWEGYRYDLIFDTRAAGCLQCDKMIRTHPTKSATAHYCLDDKCWDSHQEDQREKVSAEAKAKMEADIIRRAAEQVEVPKEANVYRIQNTSTKEWSEGEAASPEEACSKAGWKTEDCWIRVQTEQGGWGKVSFSQEKVGVKKPLPVVAEENGVAIPIPCEACAKADSCDRSYFHVADDDSGLLLCERMVQKAPEKVKIPTEIPEDILAMAREKAGTRAEVLDLRELRMGQYSSDLKQGHVLLNSFGHELKTMDNPEECVEECTKGFHYAFDSRGDDSRAYYVCTDTKCCSQKKAAFTRGKNAEGQARKKAEVKAIKEAIAQTTTLDRPRIKLILLTQIEGIHVRDYFYGSTEAKKPSKWLWDKVSAGTPDLERTQEKLFKAIDKLGDEDLAKLVVEFMFNYLTDKGDIGSYEVKTEEPLKWVGIKYSEYKAHA